MRKVFCLMVALLLCVSMVMPAFAAEDGFVPSITYKPDPDIIPILGPNGEAFIGVIRDAMGEILDYIAEEDLLFNALAHIWNGEANVPAEIGKLLKSVYEGLLSGEMQLPYEKFGAGLNPDNMVIRDLFDASWTNGAFSNMLEEEGVVLEMTFDLGVDADTQVYAMTYDAETNQWDPITQAINNGDGTVTCTFEHLCIVAFSVPLAVDEAPAESVNMMLWMPVLVLAAAAFVVIFISVKKHAVV